jgi:hypothetical protein
LQLRSEAARTEQIEIINQPRNAVVEPSVWRWRNLREPIMVSGPRCEKKSRKIGVDPNQVVADTSSCLDLAVLDRLACPQQLVQARN